MQGSNRLSSTTGWDARWLDCVVTLPANDACPSDASFLYAIISYWPNLTAARSAEFHGLNANIETANPETWNQTISSFRCHPSQFGDSVNLSQTAWRRLLHPRWTLHWPTTSLKSKNVFGRLLMNCEKCCQAVGGEFMIYDGFNTEAQRTQRGCTADSLCPLCLCVSILIS